MIGVRFCEAEAVNGSSAEQKYFVFLTRDNATLHYTLSVPPTSFPLFFPSSFPLPFPLFLFPRSSFIPLFRYFYLFPLLFHPVVQNLPGPPP